MGYSQCNMSETAQSFQFHFLHQKTRDSVFFISPISPFGNMLNTWWLCVILQYHSISHGFCPHAIDGVICCDIQYHTISRWVSDNCISRDIVIMISQKTIWKSVSLLHLPENHYQSVSYRWNRGFTSVSPFPRMSSPYFSVCKRYLIEEWLGPNHSAKAY